jgi:hypothetical protein
MRERPYIPKHWNDHECPRDECQMPSLGNIIWIIEDYQTFKHRPQNERCQSAASYPSEELEKLEIAWVQILWSSNREPS